VTKARFWQPSLTLSLSPDPTAGVLDYPALSIAYSVDRQIPSGSNGDQLRQSYRHSAEPRHAPDFDGS
jgi:hypothetical protein